MCETAAINTNSGDDFSPEEVVCTLAALASQPISDWIVDSGASRHMCGTHTSAMINTIRSKIKYITTANYNKLAVECQGEVRLPIGKNKTMLMRDVLYVPALTSNLLSVSVLTNHGYKVEFTGDTCSIVNNNGVINLPVND